MGTVHGEPGRDLVHFGVLILDGVSDVREGGAELPDKLLHALTLAKRLARLRIMDDGLMGEDVVDDVGISAIEDLLEETLDDVFSDFSFPVATSNVHDLPSISLCVLKALALKPAQP